MTLLTKLMIAGGLIGALSGVGYLIHDSIYDDGYRAGEAKVRKENSDAIAETGRLNKTIVRGDQALIVAKTIDKEKIKIIYRTIRDQLAPELIEVPVYTVCAVPAVSLRLIAQAASGSVPADPDQPARDPASGAAGAEK